MKAASRLAPESYDVMTANSDEQFTTLTIDIDPSIIAYPMVLAVPDLVIFLAYFSIPVQILWGLCRFPRLTRRATKRVVILLVLFALFIFMCGFGHLLRCLDRVDTPFFRAVNILTAVISICTAVYLMPFVPNLLEGADKLYLETTASREIIEKLYPPQIRQRLLTQVSTQDGTKQGMEMRSRGLGGTSEHQIVRQRIQDFIRTKSNLNTRNSLKVSDDEDGYDRNSDEENNLALDISNPIADDFENTSVMFADISNFTYWSSSHSPNEVFTLLESIFFEFDRIANEMGVYKLSTVGDCYIAVTGVPYPCENHAIILTQFAEQCKRKANEVMDTLSTQNNLNTDGLQMRIGIHSGPVTAGVLRGDKARFDLFGDTINTAARIESTGKPNCIHLSLETARLIEKAGRGDWLESRKDSVKAKGKGELKTFWLRCKENMYFSDSMV